jgi:hypothetical protein
LSDGATLAVVQKEIRRSDAKITLGSWLQRLHQPWWIIIDSGVWSHGVEINPQPVTGWAGLRTSKWGSKEVDLETVFVSVCGSLPKSPFNFLHNLEEFFAQFCK